MNWSGEGFESIKEATWSLNLAGMLDGELSTVSEIQTGENAHLLHLLFTKSVANHYGGSTGPRG
jgi:hypothetical protein